MGELGNIWSAVEDNDDVWLRCQFIVSDFCMREWSLTDGRRGEVKRRTESLQLQNVQDDVRLFVWTFEAPNRVTECLS